jgi:predicted RNA-binding Zn-ribbon protein involved in translation (DUF1610 family)
MKPLTLLQNLPMAIMAKLPAGAFDVSDGKIALNWPGDVTQHYVCPNCGPASEVALDVQYTSTVHMREFFVFENSHYTTSKSHHVGDDNETEEYTAIKCAKCGQTIANAGENVNQEPHGSGNGNGTR